MFFVQYNSTHEVPFFEKGQNPGLCTNRCTQPSHMKFLFQAKEINLPPKPYVLDTVQQFFTQCDCFRNVKSYFKVHIMPLCLHHFVMHIDVAKQYSLRSIKEGV